MAARKEHWEKVYKTKEPTELSWTQEIPQISLDLIRELNLPKTAKIIDIGGGNSKLADFLLNEGFENITVLDISEKSLQLAQDRLGGKADSVKWIVSDVLAFAPEETYDVWHDRATFHFLTKAEQIKKYVSIANNTVTGYMIIGTFSEKGPQKCSGLEIKQYSEAELQTQFGKRFSKIRCVTEDHRTPFNTIQNFIFCSFMKTT